MFGNLFRDKEFENAMFCTNNLFLHFTRQITIPYKNDEPSKEELPVILAVGLAFTEDILGQRTYEKLQNLYVNQLCEDGEYDRKTLLSDLTRYVQQIKICFDRQPLRTSIYKTTDKIVSYLMLIFRFRDDINISWDLYKLINMYRKSLIGVKNKDNSLILDFNDMYDWDNKCKKLLEGHSILSSDSEIIDKIVNIEYASKNANYKQFNLIFDLYQDIKKQTRDEFFTKQTLFDRELYMASIFHSQIIDFDYICDDRNKNVQILIFQLRKQYPEPVQRIPSTGDRIPTIKYIAPPQNKI